MSIEEFQSMFEGNLLLVLLFVVVVLLPLPVPLPPPTPFFFFLLIFFLVIIYITTFPGLSVFSQVSRGSFKMYVFNTKNVRQLSPLGLYLATYNRKFQNNSDVNIQGIVISR